MELSKVLDGFIDADTLIIKAQVQVIRCLVFDVSQLFFVSYVQYISDASILFTCCISILLILYARCLVIFI